MKRLCYMLIVFSVLSTIISINAFAEDNKFCFYENMEGYENGRIPPTSDWNMEEKTDGGGSIMVIDDLENEGNHICEIGVEYINNKSHDSFIETPFYSIKSSTTIAARIKNPTPSNGEITVALRDNSASSGTGSISLVSLYNNKIFFFNGRSSIAFSYDINSSNAWQDLRFVITPVSANEADIAIYHNQDFKKSVRVSGFNFHSAKLRFISTVWSGSLRTYVDDIEFYENHVIADKMLCSPPKLYLVNSGRKLARDGIWQGKYCVETGVQNKQSIPQDVILCVVYKKDGLIADVALSEQISIDAGKFANISAQITLPETEKSDCLQVMLWNNMQEIIPLASSSLKGIEIPPINTQTIQERFEIHSSENQHPRVLADAKVFDRIRSLYNSNSNDTDTKLIQQWCDNVIRYADELVGADIGGTIEKYSITYSKPDGLRLLETSRRALDFQLNLGMAYQLTKDTKYADKAWKILKQAGKPNSDFNTGFPDWNPVHFLDVGEMTAAFAIGYDWMYSTFSAEQRAYIENSIKEYGLDIAADAYAGFDIPGGNSWVTAKHNWNSVCNGGITMGSVAVADKYPDLAFSNIAFAVSSIPHLLNEFAPDGGWEEGAGYWEYMMKYLCFMAETLQSSMGTDFGITDAQGMERTAEFKLQMEGAMGTNNFHDCSWGYSSPPEVFWLAKMFNQPAWTQHNLENMKNNNINGGILSILYYSSPQGQSSKLPLDAYFRVTEAVSMRSSWDKDAAFLSFHAGRNNVNHGHIDAGTFVFDMNGVRWAEELGPDNYSLPGYFSSERWDYYRMRAEGQNTLVINPDLSAGQSIDARTYVEGLNSSLEEASCTIDLTDAYKTQAESVKRTFSLEDGRDSVVIADEIIVGENSEIYWFMHTKANVTQDSDGIILERNGKKLKMDFSVSGAKSDFSVRDAVRLETSPDPDSRNSIKQYSTTGIRKIQLKLSGKGEIKLEVRFSPYNN